HAHAAVAPGLSAAPADDVEAVAHLLGAGRSGVETGRVPQTTDIDVDEDVAVGGEVRIARGPRTVDRVVVLVVGRVLDDGWKLAFCVGQKQVGGEGDAVRHGNADIANLADGKGRVGVFGHGASLHLGAGWLAGSNLAESPAGEAEFAALEDEHFARQERLPAGWAKWRGGNDEAVVAGGAFQVKLHFWI